MSNTECTKSDLEASSLLSLLRSQRSKRKPISSPKAISSPQAIQPCIVAPCSRWKTIYQEKQLIISTEISYLQRTSSKSSVLQGEIIYEEMLRDNLIAYTLALKESVEALEAKIKDEESRETQIRHKMKEQDQGSRMAEELDRQTQRCLKILNN